MSQLYVYTVHHAWLKKLEYPEGKTYKILIHAVGVFKDLWPGAAGGQDEATTGSAPETPQGGVRQEGPTGGNYRVVSPLFLLIWTHFHG